MADMTTVEFGLKLDHIIGHLYDADDAYADYRKNMVLKHKLSLSKSGLARALNSIIELQDQLDQTEEGNDN